MHLEADSSCLPTLEISGRLNRKSYEHFKHWVFSFFLGLPEPPHGLDLVYFRTKESAFVILSKIAVQICFDSIYVESVLLMFWDSKSTCSL